MPHTPHRKPYSPVTRPAGFASPALGRAPQADAIEWEELPSLADSLARRLTHSASASPKGANDSAFGHLRSFATPWDDTLPAALDPVQPSQPFDERIEGLATREVNEPGVFQHFFGKLFDPR